VHGRQETRPDPEFESGLSASLKSSYGTPAALIELYARFAVGDGPLDAMMRRCLWRAAARRCGQGLQVGSGVGFKHLDTFEVGDNVFIGAQAYIQGRFDGTTIIGNHVWIGPQAYLDARDLVLEEYVGWGPGARVLGCDTRRRPLCDRRGDPRQVRSMEGRCAGAAAPVAGDRYMNRQTFAADEVSKPIPVAKPVLDEQEVEAVRRVILSGWVSQGPEVAAFEREFAEHVGAPHACAVSNCTTALHLALLAAGVRSGDEVITVSHSFIATANAIRYCGATPVFIDIEAAGYNLDPALVEQAVTPRTRAILCVHQLGMPCDLARIVALGRRLNVPVIEDAACASGSQILWNGRWEMIGKPHGDIACFSFHPRKVITTGEGGMITTGSPEFDRRFRLWRQHSMSVPDTVRHGSREVIFESYPEVGFNFRMTDMQAAVGRVQLTRLASLVDERRRLAREYASRLSAIEGVKVPVEPIWARTNWQSYCVELPEGCDQHAVMQRMLYSGVSTRRAVMNAHLEAPYQAASWTLPRSERAQRSGIVLPLAPLMTVSQVQAVCDSLAAALEATPRHVAHAVDRR
jgi:dTDP-4-amino-4,6-dideoxygalactose transaminase